MSVNLAAIPLAALILLAVILLCLRGNWLDAALFAVLSVFALSLGLCPQETSGRTMSTSA